MFATNIIIWIDVLAQETLHAKHISDEKDITCGKNLTTNTSDHHLHKVSGVLESDESVYRVDGGDVGEKLSNSHVCCLAQLCLAAA